MSGWLTFEALPSPGGGLAGSRVGSIELESQVFV